MTGLAHATVAEALTAAASSVHGIRTIEHDGRTEWLAYSALCRDALDIAGGLAAQGLRKGDRVAIVASEVGEFVRAFFGTSVAGLVPVPLCPPAQAGNLPTFAKQSRHILAASRAAAVVSSSDVAPLLDVSELGADSGPIPILTLDQLQGPALKAPIQVSSAPPALIQFTSGSTAAPKGVVLSHENVLANITAIAGPEGLALTAHDVGVSWLPLYHDMGLIGMLLTAVYSGLPIILMSPVLFLKRPTAWLEAISTHRATVSFAPNFAYDLCLKRVKPSQMDLLDLSSWRVAGCGAEPLRPDTLRAFGDHFARAGFRMSSFMASYGLAEHCLAVSFARRGFLVDVVDAERLTRRSEAMPVSGDAAGGQVVQLVACGRALPGHEVRIAGEDGRPLPERHVGHILARGPSVMQGYFNDPDATRETLHDGWLHTGDLGYVAGGELFVCGRTKDLIIRHGRKYHPPDLESVIGDLPGIRSSGVVVFGVSRVEQTDQVVAVLEARASQTSTDVIEQVRRRVRETAGLELDLVVVTPPGTIPRTTSGKVRRAETRERFQAGTLLSSRPASETQAVK